mgnify:CR=1 FL=1
MADKSRVVQDALAKTRLFSGLSPESLERLVPHFVERSFEKEEVIFRQGDQGESLLVLVSGQVTLALRGPGSVLGEMALLDGSERSASIYAVERSRGLTLARSSFFSFLKQHTEAFQSLLVILCQRLRESDRKVEDLGSKTLLERLAGALLDLAAAQGEPAEGGLELSPTVNYQLLTGLLCTNRESVSRAIRELRERGLLDKNGRQFLLTDLQGLADLYQSKASISQ